MLKTLLVDDEQHAIDLLSGYIQKVKGLHLTFSTTNSVEAFQFACETKPDLIFLDIHMPDLNGIQFLEQLPRQSKVILTTAYSEYALKGYEHAVVDYLMKPISFDRFLKATQRAIEIWGSYGSAQPAVEYLFVKTETRNKLIRIKLNEIDWIEALGNYVTIHANGVKVTTLSTMKDLETWLPGNEFVRVHNSFIIPFSKIKSIEGNEVRLDLGKIPIGEAFRKNFMSLIKNKMVKN